MTATPSITIGLPVYNNADFLRQMLTSILNQDYENFVVIISDDCSSDETPVICKEFVEQDSRIKFLRNEQNLGSLKNHQRVLDLAETEYFMFARGHEILPQNLFSQAILTLQSQNEVVLACAPTRWVDMNDNLIENKFLPIFDSRGCDVITRCLLVLWSKCEAFYGVGLTRNFKSVRVLEPIVGTDLIMILEMSLIGSITVLPCENRLRRYHYSENYQERVARHQNDMQEKAGLLDRTFPILRLPLAMLGSIWHGKISFLKKLAITILLLVNAPIKYFISRGKAL